MHMRKQSKRVHAEHEIAKDIPTQHDKPGTGYVGPYHLVRKYSRPKVHSYMPEWGAKDMRLPFPTRMNTDVGLYLAARIVVLLVGKFSL